VDGALGLPGSHLRLLSSEDGVHGDLEGLMGPFRLISALSHDRQHRLDSGVVPPIQNLPSRGLSRTTDRGGLPAWRRLRIRNIVPVGPETCPLRVGSIPGGRSSASA